MPQTRALIKRLTSFRIHFSRRLSGRFCDISSEHVNLHLKSDDSKNKSTQQVHATIKVHPPREVCLRWNVNRLLSRFPRPSCKPRSLDLSKWQRLTQMSRNAPIKLVKRRFKSDLGKDVGCRKPDSNSRRSRSRLQPVALDNSSSENSY